MNYWARVSLVFGERAHVRAVEAVQPCQRAPTLREFALDWSGAKRAVNVKRAVGS